MGEDAGDGCSLQDLSSLWSKNKCNNGEGKGGRRQSPKRTPFSMVTGSCSAPTTPSFWSESFTLSFPFGTQNRVTALLGKQAKGGETQRTREWAATG